jgi:RHS repeat-associated protein
MVIAMSGTASARWRHPWWFFPVVLVAVGSLVAGLIVGLQLFSGWGPAPASSAGSPVPVHVVRGRTVKIPVMHPYHAPPVSWPAATTATAVLNPASSPASGRVGAGRLAAGPSAGSARAGDLPVWVGPPDTAAATAGGKPVTTADTTGAAASQVQVGMASHATASALGVHGVVFSMAPAGGAGDRVHVSVNYASFAGAYGGGYASRLHVVELPACALTTPQVASCQTQTPLPSGSANDVRTDQVGADVTLPGAGTAAAVRPGQAVLTAAVTQTGTASSDVVLAVTGGTSGSGGNYTVPPFSEADQWVNGDSSGAYTYSYPVTVPKVPGGLEPTVALQYDSQSVDGLTSATNPQASWVGDGWDYDPGYIEQDYATCADDSYGGGVLGSPPPATGDLCQSAFSGAELTLSFNGTSTTLVDTGANGWQAETGGGYKITQDNSAATGQSYWVLTDTDGTSYYFGMDQLPGYGSGDQATNSLWTVPVDMQTASIEGDPGPWVLSQNVWRWNLDYVTDTHGDAIAYFYNDQVNYYAEDNGRTGTGQYVQGGTLSKIEYGLRAGDIYGATPAAQVNFTTAAGRQDAPTDLSCAQGTACPETSPTFWNDDALTGISTQALDGSSLGNVDSWALDGTYPATGDPTTSPSLWLSSITQTGQDGSTPITLPPTTFAGTPMPNRVMTAADTAAGYSAMTRFRLTSITNDTGGVTTIAYSSPGCTAGDFPAPDANTTACYPVYWQPGSGASGGAAPGAPAGLAVTGTLPTTVSLSWTAPAGTVSGYYVFEDGTQLSSSGPVSASVSGTTAVVSGLSPSTAYTFTVQAYNGGGAGPQSSSVQATTLAASALPGAPGTLTGTGCNIASDASGCNVSLSWGAASGIVTGYDIYEDGSLNSQVTGTSASIVETRKGTYTFYVQAYNSAETGPASSTVSVTVTQPSTGPLTAPAQQSAGTGSGPVEDWFSTYSVTSITQTDTTGGDPPVVTTYSYAGPAWHYDDDTISRSATTTWDEWRGYRTVTAQTGTAPDPVTETVDTYFQGMSGDQTGGGCSTYACGTATVTLTSSHGQTATDADSDAGSLFEDIVYDGAGTGTVVSDTIYDVSTVTTAGTGYNGIAPVTAAPTGTITYTTLAGGGTRESTQTATYDKYGRVITELDVPDTSNTPESTCTLTSYNTNTTTNVMDQVSQVQQITPDDGACTVSSASQAISSSQYTYNTAGDTTGTQQATSATEHGTTLTWTYQTSNTSTFDEYGRVLTAKDADNRTTTTAYTPAAGAEATSVQVTDPAGLVTTTAYDPARDLPLTVTDPAGDVATDQYDALGRPVSEWAPGNPVSGPATSTYSYTVSSTAPSVTTEQDEEPGGNYLTTQTLDDSLGNVREVQQETAAGGTNITDTTYNSDGWKALVSDPYYVSGAPSGTLVAAASSSVPSQTGYAYDGDGRVIKQIAYAAGSETWETDTAYTGNSVTVTPPSGGTPETTWTDGRGLTTAIWQYHAGAPVSTSDPAADYDATTYTYTPAQQLNTITDADSNQWSDTYNMLGEQLTAKDPDAGTTTSTYDPAGQLMTVTDARDKTTSYTYDLDGRKTAEYDTTGSAPESSSDELASWTYDTLAKGQLTSSTAYENGAQYTEEYTGYNSQGLPSGTETIIPPAQGNLAGTYSQAYTYAPDGTETSYTDSAAGSLPAETVTIGHDAAGDEDSLAGASTYVDSLSFTDLDQPLQYTMGTSSEPVYVTDSYDPQTGNLTEQDAQTGTAETSVDDLHYTYNDVQDITSEADTPAGDGGATDVQCFQYDYLNRLVQAWAQGTSGCATTPSASAEGGAGPYWESYTYNTIGNLTGITSTTPAGAVTTTADTYLASAAAHPHAITGQAVTTSAGTTLTSYGYDADGNLTAVTGASQNQALTWNDNGELTQDAVTSSGGTAQDTNYIYDADGTLLLTADPGTTTLYLPDEELALSTGTGTVTGTRYYTLNGTTIATLTGASSVAYLTGDQQDTTSLAIDATTLNLTRRYYDPYGNTRGTPATDFPAGEKGFVGGADDPATGLTDLGAREYQPQTGSFISTDPLLNPYDPQDLNAYTYATDNPTTLSDPTGQCTPAPGRFCAQVSAQTAKDEIKTDKPQGQSETNPVTCSAQTTDMPGCHGWKPPRGTATHKPAKHHRGCGPLGLDCVGHALKESGKRAAKVAAVTGEVLMAITGGPDLLGTLCENEEENEEGNPAEDGGESFTASTRVLLAGGKTAPISSLRVGEKVLATSTSTGKTQPETVMAVLIHHDSDLYNLKIKSHGKTAVTHATGYHLFWVPGTGNSGHWVQAAQLKPGTRLRTPGGSDTATVTGGWYPQQSTGTMWDLTIPGNNDHDFYVVTSGGTAVLVHNNSCSISSVSGPNGESLPLPEAPGVPTDSGKGYTYDIPAGTPGLDPRVTQVRIMDPVTSGKHQYPKGYVVYMNKAGQSVNPLTGQTIAKSSPYNHLPLP